MKQIQPLESATRRIHSISDTEIMPFDIYCDISRYVLGGSTNGHKMSALHSLRNAVISRRADAFVDMATFSLQLHQLSQHTKPKAMNTARLNALALLIISIIFTGIFFILQFRIERLEEKVLRIQQQVGYYESDNP